MESLVTEEELKKKLGEDVFHCEALVGHKGTGKSRQFLVKWKGYSDANNTWEPERNILDKNMIRAYEEKLKNGGPATSKAPVAAAVAPTRAPPTIRPPPTRRSAPAATVGRRGGRKASQSARKRLKVEDTPMDDVDMEEEKTGVDGVKKDGDSAATSSTPPVAANDVATTSRDSSTAKEEKKDDSSSAVEEKADNDQSSNDSAVVTEAGTAVPEKPAEDVPLVANGLPNESHVSESSPPRGSQPVLVESGSDVVAPVVPAAGPVDVPSCAVVAKSLEESVTISQNGSSHTSQSRSVTVIVSGPGDGVSPSRGGFPMEDETTDPLADSSVKLGDSGKAAVVADQDGRSNGEDTAEKSQNFFHTRGVTPEYKQL